VLCNQMVLEHQVSECHRPVEPPPHSSHRLRIASFRSGHLSCTIAWQPVGRTERHEIMGDPLQPAPHPDPEEQVSSESRGPDGRFAKGGPPGPGRPPGTRDFTTQLIQAMRVVEQEEQISMLEYAWRRAKEEDRVLIALLNKLIPTQSEVRLDGPEVHTFIDRMAVLLIDRVPDPQLRVALGQAISQLANQSGEASDAG